MRCRAEEVTEKVHGRCANPGCRYRHEHAMAYRLHRSVLSQAIGVSLAENDRTTFDTWVEAVQAVDALKEHRNPCIGRPGTLGFGLEFYNKHRRQIFAQVARFLSIADACGKGVREPGEQIVEGKKFEPGVVTSVAERDELMTTAISKRGWIAALQAIGRFAGGSQADMNMLRRAVDHYDLFPVAEDPAPIKVRKKRKKLRSASL